MLLSGSTHRYWCGRVNLEQKLNADIERLQHRVDTALSMRQAPSSHSVALRPSPPASPARSGGGPANLLTSSQQTQQV